VPYCAPAWLYVDTAPASLSATITMRPGPDHHQEGEQIARPLGFHYPPADRHYFGLHAGRGRYHCPIAHGSISLPPRADTTRPLRISTVCAAENRQLDVLLEMSKGKPLRPGSRSVRLQPSAFTTKILVEEAAAEAIARGLSDCRRNFHAASSRGALRAGRLIVVGFHIPFWRQVRSSAGNKKAIPPGAEEMANYRRTIADGFPHWSKLQHRTP